MQGDALAPFLCTGGSVFGEEKMGEPELPSAYYIDESDPDILILRREDGTFVAAFSAFGATREGIAEAAVADYQALEARKLASEGEAQDTRGP